MKLTTQALILAHKIKTNFKTWSEALKSAWATVKERLANNKLTFSKLIAKLGFEKVPGRWEVSGVRMKIVIKGNGIQAHFANAMAFARWTNKMGYTSLNPAPAKKGVESYIKKIK